jgi:hypothetical protein
MRGNGEKKMNIGIRGMSPRRMVSDVGVVVILILWMWKVNTAVVCLSGLMLRVDGRVLDEIIRLRV